MVKPLVGSLGFCREERVVRKSCISQIAAPEIFPLFKCCTGLKLLIYAREEIVSFQFCPKRKRKKGENVIIVIINSDKANFISDNSAQ